MISVPDDSSDLSAGGVLVKAQWGSFLSTQVMPVLSGLMCGASENDAYILRKICATLRGTAIQGTDIAATVANLWMTYNMVYRPSLQSSKIPITADQALYSAKQYAERYKP